MNIQQALAKWSQQTGEDPNNWVDLEPETLKDALDDLSFDFPDNPLPLEVTAFLAGSTMTYELLAY
jgi:hypothetical protein